MAIKDLIRGGWSKGVSPLFEEGHPLVSLQRQMNSLLEEFMSGAGFEPAFAGAFSPRVNVSEDKEKLYVTMELPGLSEKDIEVSLMNDSLTIRGEKKEEFEEREGRNRYHMERRYGRFQRTIPLQVEIDQDKVDAVFKDGVLRITLNKTREAQSAAKKIPIRQ